MNVALPDFAEPLFNPYRYKVLYGGRGSAKSHSIARVLLIRGAMSKRRVLCTREFQNSINESVYKLLCDRIDEMNLQGYYTTTQNRIYSPVTGTEFIFKGVRHNVDSIKSMENLTDCWIEEAQMVSQRSWDIIIPTIRAEGSEIWVSFNPENEDDPTYQKFVMQRPPENSYVKKVNWEDNPWFPKVLRDEMEHSYATNPDLADHIWGGACRSQSDAQIFKGKYRVDDFEIKPDWDGPYFGADWGFSNDPTCAVAVWIDPIFKRLYIRYETGDIEAQDSIYGKASKNGGVGIELEDIPKLFDQIPGIRDRLIRADSARPETISFVAKKKFLIEAAEKWPGSVEDGIEFMKSFVEIIIHPSCTYTREEFKNYSFKVDRLTGDVTNVIVDAWNHRIDAIRYGLGPLISSEGSLLDVL